VPNGQVGVFIIKEAILMIEITYSRGKGILKICHRKYKKLLKGYYKY
jgi:hypothetical protein